MQHLPHGREGAQGVLPGFFSSSCFSVLLRIFRCARYGSGAFTQVGSPVPNLCDVPSTRPTSLALAPLATHLFFFGFLPRLCCVTQFLRHTHIPCCCLIPLFCQFHLSSGQFHPSQSPNNLIIYSTGACSFHFPGLQYCFHSPCKLS